MLRVAMGMPYDLYLISCLAFRIASMLHKMVASNTVATTARDMVLIHGIERQQTAHTAAG